MEIILEGAGLWFQIEVLKKKFGLDGDVFKTGGVSLIWRLEFLRSGDDDRKKMGWERMRKKNRTKWLYPNE